MVIQYHNKKDDCRHNLLIEVCDITAADEIIIGDINSRRVEK